MEELKGHSISHEHEERQEAGLEDAGPEVRESFPKVNDRAIGFGRGLFSQEKAVVLIKAMTVLVILLLAVEAVLYLI